ncbi:swi5-dependent recombination DNA repair protein 1 homolog [Centruroides vittatus]|uniref:swi5-dependent recombination DNA repair protein 1 homolog n=1 Tax=Centruroides vittatus TaxID=120091 RepID=UPI003510AE2F
MSSSLKEKLRRLHKMNSLLLSPTDRKVPVTESKRNNPEKTEVIISDNEDNAVASANIKLPVTETISNKEETRKHNIPIPSRNENFTNSESDLILELKLLKDRVSKKEEILRKLNMVKTYHTKNNLTKLTELIEKWRNVAQDSLKELQTKLPGPQQNLNKLVCDLQIDHKLIKYDFDEEDFIM